MLLTNFPSIQRVPVDELKLAKAPVRRHPPKEVEKTRRLLTKLGQVLPVLAAPDGEIIFGDVIWLGLKANGSSEVDALIVNGKSVAELKVLQLALNRIPLDACWDDKNVSSVLEQLVNLGAD